MDEAIYSRYQHKREKVLARLTAIKKQIDMYVVLRPLAFLGAVGFSLAYSFGTARISYLLGIGVLAIIFFWMVGKHKRIKAEANYWHSLVSINENAMRRMEGKWTEFANTGERFNDAEHRYASDLNIFGRASLFQYVNAATSLVGEARLAQMLMAPASLTEIEQRQQAIQELSPRLDWRQHLQATGMPERSKKTGNLEQLLAWAEEELSYTNRYIPLLLLMPLLTVLFAVLGYFNFIPPYLWIFTLALQILIVAFTSNTAQQTFAKTDHTVHELRRYTDLLACIEPESFTTPLLNSLQKKLTRGGSDPSRQIKQLFTIVEKSDVRYSSLHPLINIGLLWDLQTLIKLQQWRNTSGRSLRAWIKVIAEFEALSSLAGLAYEHPDWAKPDISAAPPALKAVALGHPLIKDEVRVCNDVELAAPGTVLLITGSNMSGKSTLLRTVGINLVLACAGAPVCAKQFNCSLMDVYSSIHINDNLEKNISNFYAELLRIKLIVEAARTGKPMLFLIDEIFKGTNSKDRILGAQAVIKSLHELGAIGLVSTHDLELSRLEESIPLIKNYHFTDRISGNEITFDYRLKPGVSKSTNALALMKIIGLEV
jgi:ABC-type multidrug transport system fused ATPase/permease subunit